MDLVIDLSKSIILIFGISLFVTMLMGVLGIAMVRRNAQGKLWGIFVEPNREVTSELLSLDLTTPGKVNSTDGGEYVVSPNRVFSFSWPPGYPSWVREPIPCCIFVRNQAEPIDPTQTESIVTAQSLKYMLDEGMLRQTWLDARDSLGEGSAVVKKNLPLILSGVSIVATLIMGYIVWTMSSTITDIAIFIGA